MSSKFFVIPTATIFLAAIFTAPLALADEPKPSTISVSATGTATIVPDTAILNLAVTREGKTAREALSANTAAMTKVLTALKESGIEGKDLQTSNFNIQPRYHYPNRTTSGEQKPPKIVGYIVHNGLTVRIRKLDDLGKILDRAVTLGVNSGGDISFTTDKPEAAIKEARKNAMARAIEKAKTLTGAASIGLGKILEISEQNRGTPRPRALRQMAESKIESSMAVPVARGENSYSVTINVRWELAQ